MRKHFESLDYDFVWLKSSCRFNSENITVVALINPDRVFKLSLLWLLCKLNAFLAEVAFVSIFNINILSHLIEGKNFAGASSNQLLLLFCIKTSKFIVVQDHNRFSTHNASGHRGPFSVSAADSLLSDQTEVKNLIATESHDQDRIVFLTFVSVVLDRHHVCVLPRVQLDIVRRYVAVLLIRRTFLKKSIVYRASVAEVCAVTLTVRHKIINIVADERNQT